MYTYTWECMPHNCRSPLAGTSRARTPKSCLCHIIMFAGALCRKPLRPPSPHWGLWGVLGLGWSPIVKGNHIHPMVVRQVFRDRRQPLCLQSGTGAARSRQKSSEATPTFGRIEAPWSRATKRSRQPAEGIMERLLILILCFMGSLTIPLHTTPLRLSLD